MGGRSGCREGGKIKGGFFFFFLKCFVGRDYFYESGRRKERKGGRLMV